MKEVKAPKEYRGLSQGVCVFLAGSIEMGSAPDWPEIVSTRFRHLLGIILNPRRDDWDKSWKQSRHDKRFYEQVDWELGALEAADLILMYLAPETKSPISLLELGLFARSGKLFVACPDAFYRRGNVELVCERYKIPLFRSLDSMLQHTENYLRCCYSVLTQFRD